jgi:hypothetical protein
MMPMETEMSKDTAGSAAVAALVAQARTAYQQNRIKECLTLVRTVLQADPTNAAALEVQTAVRFDMQRDLSDARSLIEESRNKPEAQKFRKAAEIILLKALYLDPESEGAKTLLSSVRAPQDVPLPAIPVAPPVAAPVAPGNMAPSAPVYSVPVAEPAPIVETAEPSRSHSETPSETRSVSSSPSSYGSEIKMGPPETIPFTTGTAYEKPVKRGRKGSTLTIPIVVVGVLVVGGGLMLVRQWMGSTEAGSTAGVSSSTIRTDETSSSRPNSNPVTAGSTSTSSDVEASPALPVTANAPSTKPLPNTPAGLPPLPGTPAKDPVATPAANSRPGAAAAQAMGSLAVSSAIAAEIYQGDKLLGSTPTTLQFPAGNQTLEYRHGDLRTVVTHIVKANETTPALITFDVIVQLNANPWANVSIEGSTRLPLGQTPLSNVKLPIGSVLVFENPNFPSKSHKIAVDDKTIQMVFQ